MILRKISFGPDGIFPSESDDDQHFFFPSEESLDQTLVPEVVPNVNHTSDSSVSDNEVVHTGTNVDE